jgi:peptidyl-prolyl cis-trans isomerase D
MLGWMRKQTRSWFVYVAFGIIIIVFVFFYGYSGRGGPGQSVVAVVNDHKITRKQYEKNYENLLMASRNVYNKTSFTEEELKQLRQRALDDLIERTLMLLEADRLGITVSLDETRKEIAQTPAFQRGGGFDKELYLRQLSAIRLSPSEFEKAVRTDTIISKLMDNVKNTAKLSDRELFDLYRLENEKVNLAFMKVNPLNFDDKVEITPQELEDFFETTKENYRIPDRVKVRYLSLDPEQFKEDAKITPEEVELYYRMNTERFTQKKRVKARHILIEVNPQEGSDAEEKARKKAVDLRTQIEEGDDFAKLAKQYSKDSATASKGGDLGFFEKGQMVKEFEEVAFSLKAGELGPVVRTPLGFHIITVEALEEEKKEPLEKAQTLIEEELKSEQAEEIVRKEARRAGSLIYRSGNLIEYAQENGLKVIETGFFAAGEPIEGIGINKDCSNAVLVLKEDEVSPVIKAEKNYYVFQLIEREKSYLPTLEGVKEQVARRVRRDKAKEVAQTTADELLKEIAAGASMDQIAKREAITIQETGFFTRRSNFIGQIGPLEELIQDAFTLTPEHPFPQKVYSTGTAYFLVALKEREEIEQEKFLSEKEKKREQLIQQKRDERARLWLEGLKAEAQTKIFMTL